jgi:hypothetical protein
MGADNYSKTCPPKIQRALQLLDISKEKVDVASPCMSPCSYNLTSRRGWKESLLPWFFSFYFLFLMSDSGPFNIFNILKISLISLSRLLYVLPQYPTAEGAALGVASRKWLQNKLLLSLFGDNKTSVNSGSDTK